MENASILFQTVKHDFTLEEAMHYVDTLDRFLLKPEKSFA